RHARERDRPGVQRRARITAELQHARRHLAERTLLGARHCRSGMDNDGWQDRGAAVAGRGRDSGSRPDRCADRAAGDDRALAAGVYQAPCSPTVSMTRASRAAAFAQLLRIAASAAVASPASIARTMSSCSCTDVTIWSISELL